MRELSLAGRSLPPDLVVLNRGGTGVIRRLPQQRRYRDVYEEHRNPQSTAENRQLTTDNWPLATGHCFSTSVQRASATRRSAWLRSSCGRSRACALLYQAPALMFSSCLRPRASQSHSADRRTTRSAAGG